MTIQPAECHACCLRAGFLACQPVVDNPRGTRVEQVVSSFQKPQGLATHIVLQSRFGFTPKTGVELPKTGVSFSQ